MPIYEYLCEDCGTSFEKLVRASQTEEVACPGCGEHHVAQQLSTFAPRNGEGAGSRADSMPSCPSGMCATPGLCGRN